MTPLLKIPIIKNYAIIFLMCVSGIGYGQELVNFYLEPTWFNGNLALHTDYYAPNGAGFTGMEYKVTGNVVDVFLCYTKGSTTSITYDRKVFGLNILEEGDYILNITLIGNSNGIPCDFYAVDGYGTKAFSYPYAPTETVEILDDNFEAYIEHLKLGDNQPNNNLVFKHRIENLTRLEMNGSTLGYFGIDPVESLSGIENFISLRRFYCGSNPITEIDLSQNVDLEWLFATGSLCSTVDVSNSPNLTLLYIGSPKLTEIDLSNNTKLIDLMVIAPLIELDLSTNANLRYLHINNSTITDLDFSNNVVLEWIWVGTGSLNSVVIGGKEKLEYISFANNELTTIDLSQAPNLKSINLGFNQIETLDLSVNPHMESVALFSNELTNLSIRNGNNKNLKDLYTIGNPNLFCIEVDDEVAAYTYGWLVDQHTEFSEDCTLPAPFIGSKSISESLASLEVSIYPNPAHNVLFIESKTIAPGQLSVFSAHGRLLKTMNGDARTQIDVSQLPPGLYFLKIASDGKPILKKFIKK